MYSLRKDVSSISVLTCNGNGSYTERHIGITAERNGETATEWWKPGIRLRRFKSDRDEIRQDCSSRKYASILRSRIFWRHFLDGGHDVVKLRRKVLPPGEWTRSICPAPMQQRPPVPDL